MIQCITLALTIDKPVGMLYAFLMIDQATEVAIWCSRHLEVVAPLHAGVPHSHEPLRRQRRHNWTSVHGRERREPMVVKLILAFSTTVCRYPPKEGLPTSSNDVIRQQSFHTSHCVSIALPTTIQLRDFICSSLPPYHCRYGFSLGISKLRR